MDTFDSIPAVLQAAALLSMQEPHMRYLLDEATDNPTLVDPNRMEGIIATSTAPTYEREENLFMEILTYNIAENNVKIPQHERVYDRPAWSWEGVLACLHPPHPTTSASTNVTFYDEFPDFGFDHDKYVAKLHNCFYRDKEWFRCVVASFWGTNISVFLIMVKNRAFIQIASEDDFNFDAQPDEFYKNVAMFAYIMGRTRLGDGPNTLTDVFGFYFAITETITLCEFENLDRLEGVMLTGLLKSRVTKLNKKLAISHHMPPFHREVVDIGDTDDTDD
ncbi:hypothetical protein GGR54DRAFT_653073 [Hypoxylon sp. NC1633]|nr:hypothetical protein GGR54DRAFT_653073 [Hypoxylon sp. NC1633]